MAQEGVERIGPYRVVERLGFGGMGEVYKAYDDRLDRAVAIKRIRADKEQTEDNRARFRREAQAAARLNHSAIVHVYDIFQDGDADCIVMELVEGQGLDKLLVDGPLSPRRAIEIGRQVTAGLAEAHSKGILHRDLKTENVILTEDGQAKILDFGLAKPIVKGDLDTSLTGKGQVVGTSRAMSPEYVGGDPIDHRADLFSLGVLLYETVAGQSPFRAHNTLATLKRIILHKQIPAHEVNPAVPYELSMLIESLLEKEPVDRPGSAREIEEALGRIAAQTTSDAIDLAAMTGTMSAVEIEALTGWRAARRWRQAALVLFGALVVVTVVYLAFLRTGSRIDFEESDQVVIGDFINTTGEEIFDEGLSHAFELGLKQGRFARVVSQQEIEAALQRMELPPGTPIDRERGIEIAQREGAKALVLGTLVKVGVAYSITGEVVDPQTGRSAFVETRTAQDQDRLIPALDEIAQAIRVGLGESLARIEASTKPLARVTTSNLEALKAYSRAADKIDSHEFEEAIVLLEEAIRLDPEFAMAHAMLGTAHRNFRRDRSIASRHYLVALEHANRLSRAEKLYVEAWVATLLQTPAEMLTAWTRMTTLEPENVEGHYNLAMVYWQHLNQLSQAAGELKIAAEVSGGDERRRLYATFQLGHCQLGLGQAREALASFEAAGDDVSLVGLIGVHLTLGNFDQARKLLVSSGEGADSLDIARGQVLYNLFRGAYREAINEASVGLVRALSQDAQAIAHSFQLQMLAAHEQLGQTAELYQLWQDLLSDADTMFGPDDTKFNSPKASLLAFLGRVALRSGYTEEAQIVRDRILSMPEVEEFPVLKAGLMGLEADLLAHQDRTGEAIDTLRGAIALINGYQDHATLARLLSASGRTEEAADELRWLLDNRGRALVECSGTCFGQHHNIVEMGQARLLLAQMSDETGDTEAAIDWYRRFIEVRRGGDSVPELMAAHKRLAQLERLGQSATR